MTCPSCTNSLGTPTGLQCTAHNQPAVEVCEEFEYEPGTDSEEFRLACEVRYVIALRSREDRADYLAGVRRKRGDVGADLLEVAVKLECGKK